MITRRTFLAASSGGAVIVGPDGPARDDLFTLRFRTAATDQLPRAIRTFVHHGRPPTPYLGPVGPEGTSLEAIVNHRTVRR